MLSRALTVTTLIVCLLFCGRMKAARFTSVQEAVKKGNIFVTLRAKGGGAGRVILMEVKNLKAEPVALIMEAGRRLLAPDSITQDMLVTLSDRFYLDASQETVRTLSAMCCKAERVPPLPGTIFSIGKMEIGPLYKVARFLDSARLQNFAAQQAVWVISDHHRLESVSPGKVAAAQNPLIRFLCRLTGQPVPAFYIGYASCPGMAFCDKPAGISGTVDYTLSGNDIITIAVYDKRNTLVKMFQTGPQNAGTYSYDYSFSVQGYPHTTFYLRVFSDGRLLKEVPIQL